MDFSLATNGPFVEDHRWKWSVFMPRSRTVPFKWIIPVTGCASSLPSGHRNHSLQFTTISKSEYTFKTSTSFARRRYSLSHSITIQFLRYSSLLLKTSLLSVDVFACGGGAHVDVNLFRELLEHVCSLIQPLIFLLKLCWLGTPSLMLLAQWPPR